MMRRPRVCGRRRHEIGVPWPRALALTYPRQGSSAPPRELAQMSRNTAQGRSDPVEGGIVGNEMRLQRVWVCVPPVPSWRRRSRGRVAGLLDDLTLERSVVAVGIAEVHAQSARESFNLPLGEADLVCRLL